MLFKDLIHALPYDIPEDLCQVSWEKIQNLALFRPDPLFLRICSPKQSLQMCKQWPVWLLA